MKTEEKQLLLKDICARLPYMVKVKVRSNYIRTVRVVDMVEGIVHFLESDSISPFGVYIEHPTTSHQAVKPYLRPISSMTDEEHNKYSVLYQRVYYKDSPTELDLSDVVDWLNSHHFDYRGLIEKGLALEAPEGMYKTE